MLSGTRWGHIFRHTLGTLHRELRITLTRVPSPNKWVFIAGCYNSGTTLLNSLLGSHPSVSALPTEGQYLTDQLPTDHEIGLSRMWTVREDMYRLDGSSVGPDVIRIKKEWGSRHDRSRPVLLECTPANVARMRWLDKNFENAHFVAIVRNGYAVAEGIRRKGRPSENLARWPIARAASQWERSNEIMLEDSAHLKKFLLIKYEDLVEDPVAGLNQICRFLEVGEDLIDPEGDWHVHERSGPISNMNAKSVAALSSQDIMQIEKHALPMLRRFDYQVISDGDANQS